MATTFGPSAIATPANAITVSRLLLSPALWLVIADQGATWPVLALWMAVASTDGLDGWVARKMGTTRSGAFLDPLADKTLVIGAMWAVVAADGFWWLPVALITVRELVISVFRSYWVRRGLAVPASVLAKVKTVAQSLVVGVALLPPLDGSDAAWLVGAGLWVAVVLTLVSGAQYLQAGSSATTPLGSRPLADINTSAGASIERENP
jgi:CDP-diacylglycerol---glycerol-3-phosphate 3-phosphatidyltransferase